jgi:hypothetical protein
MHLSRTGTRNQPGTGRYRSTKGDTRGLGNLEAHPRISRPLFVGSPGCADCATDDSAMWTEVRPFLGSRLEN